MTADERDALAGLAKTVAAHHILLTIKSIAVIILQVKQSDIKRVYMAFKTTKYQTIY